MYEEEGLIRNSTHFTTSSECIIRPEIVDLEYFCLNSSLCPKSTLPGAIELTLIPLPWKTVAKYFV
jgi:hypothetical protein